MNMVKAKYNSSQDMMIKLRELKGRIKLKFYKNISNYYVEMKNKNFQTQDRDPFCKNAQGHSKIYHEVLMLMKFLQTKPQVKNMNINYYDFYFTVIKTREENKNIDNQYEDNDNDYINFHDFITPNQYVGIKPRETVLK